MPTNFECNRDNVKLLVAALRSGEYQQGQNALAQYEEDGTITWCCLGVGCDVALKNGLEVVAEAANPEARGIHGEPEDDPAEFKTFIAYDGNWSFLPDSVMQFYGFTSNDPLLRKPESVNYPYDYISAATLNDQGGNDFDVIADAFEQTYLSDD